MLTIAYILLAIIYFSFAVSPKKAVLLAIFLKPIIDMFWWAKNDGVLVASWLSPLYLAGIAIPLVSILMTKRVNQQTKTIPEDVFVFGYIVSIIALGSLKFFTQPEYFSNAIQVTAKTVTPIAFFWVGRYYFKSESDRKTLFYVLLLRAIFPFLLTFGQMSIGETRTMDDVLNHSAYGTRGNTVSGFYVGSRHDVQRISGVYEGVYELGFLGMFSLLLSIVGLYTTKTRKKYILILMAALGSYFVFFTFSRTVWATTIVTLLLLFCAKKDFKRLALTIFGIVVIYFSSTAAQYRFEDEIGFLAGEVEFGQVGYGRGNVWTDVFESIHRRDPVLTLTGGFGVGNPENQFLGMLTFNGYVGLFVFVALLLYLSSKFLVAILRFSQKDDQNNNLLLLFSCLIFTSYWLSGLGNAFNMQISEQWILWLWTGIVIESLRSTKKVSNLYSLKPAHQF